ncbi:ArsR/SmtB family transcription factor [Bacillus sp. FJAT-27986]|uniref:ArsR/SmtB family transcription factor n=1 Tax=Bacillus sp. FJAT-27986 TaxID=1743146 RepID=UPI00080ACCD0|nr:ArsR family transcriptional regulator [Bacillus sp. FJAT-27986]OCA86781.1 ArsR family transcriptional regulator [Bacillus sp. FJAT-27986]
MQDLYSFESIESLSMQVESSPVWEVILGIAGYTHEKMRHTFEQEAIWSSWENKLPISLSKDLKEIEDTNLWYGLIMLQAKFSSSSIQEFRDALADISPNTFYETVLPYKNRVCEEARKNTAINYKEKHLFTEYSKHFSEHDYLGDYVLNLGKYQFKEICVLYQTIINGWYQWVRSFEEWNKWLKALEFEEKQHQSLEEKNPTEIIEQISGRANYIPEPSVWSVKMVPHVSYRPWILEIRTVDTKLIFYPVKEDYFRQSNVPSQELIAGHKALGDELRLKLLHQLIKGPRSLQELSVQFLISKTTLHHQLSILKSAKFIRADKGIYSINAAQLKDFSTKLFHYLGNPL